MTSLCVDFLAVKMQA
jgi:2-methylcitrate dehydratase PrpD